MALSGRQYEYDQCSYNTWSSEFQNCLHESIIIPVPDNVLAYLKSDLMVLPKSSVTSCRNSSESNGIWSTAEEGLEEPELFDFDETLKNTIQDLGGKVFIKLNWSAPKDASWITSTRSLCCSDPADIYLLLKSSACISNDLSLLKKVSDSKSEVPCYLVLKKWEEIHPGTEYRCFVLNKNLVGISQRDMTSYFKYIGDNKESIVELNTKFFLNRVKSIFPLDSYTFDIVIVPGKKIILIDFGVLNKDTNCLLFSWKALEKKKTVVYSEEASKTPLNLEIHHPPCGAKQNGNEENFKPEFRYIDEFTNVTQNKCNHYGIPEDVMHFCSGEKNVADFIREEILNNRLW